MIGSTLSLYSIQKFFFAKTKFTLAELGLTRQYLGEDLKAYVKRFMRKHWIAMIKWLNMYWWMFAFKAWLRTTGSIMWICPSLLLLNWWRLKDLQITMAKRPRGPVRWSAAPRIKSRWLLPWRERRELRLQLRRKFLMARKRLGNIMFHHLFHAGRRKLQLFSTNGLKIVSSAC